MELKVATRVRPSGWRQPGLELDHHDRMPTCS